MMQVQDLYNQYLTISNELWNVQLYYEHEYSDNKSSEVISKPIFVNEIESDTFLKIVCSDFSGNQNVYFLSGLDGGYYLYGYDEISKSYIVKLENDNLIMSLGFTFFSFNLKLGKVDWKLRPDRAEIFEFYEIENDYLVRGEMAIHRITKNSQVKWSYGGRDIWVNVNGKNEVQINSDNIHLTDFEDNEYLIDFNGKTLKDMPRYKTQNNIKKWWKFWQ